jgi:hypothetical protein
VTFSVPSIAGKTLGTNSDDYIELQLRMPINTVMTVDIGQIMINDGPYPAPFARAGGELAGELLKCQRYYETLSAAGSSVSASTNFTGTRLVVTGMWRVRKRSVSGFVLTSENIQQNGVSVTGLSNSGGYDTDSWSRYYFWTGQTIGTNCFYSIQGYIDNEL